MKIDEMQDRELYKYIGINHKIAQQFDNWVAVQLTGELCGLEERYARDYYGNVYTVDNHNIIKLQIANDLYALVQEMYVKSRLSFNCEIIETNVIVAFSMYAAIKHDHFFESILRDAIFDMFS